MSLKKFGPKDIITNTMRTHPSCEFFINDSQIYYNNIPYTSGTISHGASVPISSGYASLFEMNVDRLSASALVVAGGLPGGRFIGGTSAENVIADYTLLSSGAPWMVGHGATAGGGTGTYTYSSTAADGLQGWWKLKGNAPAAGAPDLAGDNDGTISTEMDGAWPGGTSEDPTIPTSGYGMTRVSRWPDDTGAGINVGAATTWDGVIGKTGDGTSKMTFATWVYYTGTGQSNFPRIFDFGKTTLTSDGGVRAYVNTAGKIQLRTQWDSNRGDWKTDDAVITSDTWHHVVITYDAGSTSNDPVFYIDGSSVDITEQETPAGTWGGIVTNDCFIGNQSVGSGDAGSQDPGDKGWYGKMAQFSVWSSILSSDEVSALYAASDGNGVYDVRGGYVSSEIIDNGLIYPYVTKDGTRVSLNTLYTGSSYEIDFEYGDVVSGSYPLSASITRELIGWSPVGCAAGYSTCVAANRDADTDFLPNNGPYAADASGGSRGAGELNTGAPCLRPSSDDTSATCEDIEDALRAGGSDSTEKCADRTPTAGGLDSFSDISCNSPRWPHYWALKNTYRNYEYLSQHFALTSSYGIKDHQMINLISIPSIFYGSKIKPGTVSLKWYLTGTLIGELRDTKQNGELIQVTGNNPHIVQYGVDDVAGVVFYNKGFIALTGSWKLNKTKGVAAGATAKVYTAGQITIRSGSGNTPYAPMWIDWGAGANDNCNKYTTSTSGSEPTPVISASNNFESASFALSFKGTNEVQTLTMFAHAKRGEVNYSNNPTFMIHTQSVTSSIFTSSYSYVEDQNRQVVNFVSSSHPDYSASFERQVYISRVGLYDENKNLIGVATLSNPVRKEEAQDLTFKLKLDI